MKPLPEKSSYAKLAFLAAIVLLLGACSSVAEGPELETSATVKKLWIRVSSDRDDAEERSSGKVVTSSTDIELTYDVKRGQQLVGLRFNNLKIPQGAKIKHAHVRFKADETDKGAVKLRIRGDDNDNAGRFVEKRHNLSSRKLTSASVTWQPVAWRKVGEKGGKQWTPDISKVLQEVVSRKGWKQGNSFAVLIDSKSKAKRVAESYRGDKKGAPLLYIEYTLDSSAGPSSPTPAPKPTSKPKSVLYVSPNGSDNNDGRSKDKPLQTLSHTAKLVRPGDTVYLRGGVHKGYLTKYFETDGKKDARITITSYPGERAIVEGKHRSYKDSKSVSNPTLFRILADYYTVQDITFRNSAGRGLYLKGNHTIVRNVLTHDHHSDGIYSLGSYGLFEGTVSHGNYSVKNGGDSADGIKIASGHHNTVRNFLAYNNSDDGIDIFCSSNALVEYNVSHSNGRGYSGNGNGFKLGCRHTINSKNVARYNLAYKNRTNNFDSNSAGGVIMFHNTSWKAGGHGFVAYAPKSSGLAPNIVKNNISYQDKKAKGMSRDDVSSYNSWDRDIAISDPKFVSLNPSSRDFLELRKDSQALDAGTKVGLSYKGKAPDLGALEYGMSVTDLLGPTVKALQGGTLKLAAN